MIYSLRFHSTETALLKIHNDIVDNMDNDKVTALTLLDFSVAFDMIDHLILLQRIRRHFDISGTTVRWFKSYFLDIHQSNNIFDTLSRPQHLPFGVPQGSVLGPVLFSLYTTSLSQVSTNHNLSHHVDDTQVYISLSQSNIQESVSTLSDCLTDILFWMESSKLKLNPDKTDLIIICTKQQRNRVISHFPVKHQILFVIYVLSLVMTSTFASIFLKYINPVSIIYVISVEFGIIYLYLRLKQYQRH